MLVIGQQHGRRRHQVRRAEADHRDHGRTGHRCGGSGEHHGHPAQAGRSRGYHRHVHVAQPNATHVTLTFPTKAGNLVVAAYAPDANAAPTVVNAAECRGKSTIHATYTVDGSKSTGSFAGATGSGKATVVFEADAPKYTSGSQSGQCNMSSNVQPLAAGALATFAASGPLTLK